MGNDREKLRLADRAFMRRALLLAEKGRGRTRPNPMVGAVVVRNGRVVGQAYHRRAGEPHAEVLALSAAGGKARGATLYVNLEPCCHTDKRTPPCTRAVIESGIRRIVVGMTDPNPKVRGGGIRALRRAGIHVTKGILEERCVSLNEVYIKYITTGRPFVTMKAGMSLDGKIGMAGSSLRITGPQALREAHRLRAEADAVIVGSVTLRTDDPRLTTRLPGGRGRDPHRVVLASLAHIPADARFFARGPGVMTMVAVTRKASARRIRLLEEKGAVVLVLPETSGKVSLRALLKGLGRLGITSVLIEGGGEVNASALAEGVVDKIVLFVAPVLLGGGKTVPWIAAGRPLGRKRGLRLNILRWRVIGNDLMIEARP